MSFDSLTYLLFLPAVALLRAALPQPFRWMLLLIASAIFYASWNVPLTLLLYGVVGVSYAAGLLMNHIKTAGGKRAVLITALGVCIGLLLYFKYFQFLADTAQAVLHLFGGQGELRVGNIILPVGVSFYTFQAMSYVIDVYRGMKPERHFGYYALYISFFPQLVAGPIERAGTLLPQLKEQRDVSAEDRRQAWGLLLSGFFRKIVIADFCGLFVDRVYSATAPDGSAALIATALFSLQIYCDFAGYSEIARGSARLLGVSLMKNFDRPYLAPDFRTFWRRWHISLSGWFTDYVYIPLGGSKKGLSRQLAATLAVFLLSGLWHGANLTFLVWGLLHGFLVMLNALLNRAGWSAAGSRLKTALSTALTFALVTLLWVFFRAQTLPQAIDLLGRIFAPWHLESGLAPLGMTGPDGLRLLLTLAALPLLHRKESSDMTRTFLFIIIVLAWFLRLDTNAVSAFIYFQF